MQALDSTASVLRRHVLQTGEEGSPLLTLRSREAIFKLPGEIHPITWSRPTWNVLTLRNRVNLIIQEQETDSSF